MLICANEECTVRLVVVNPLVPIPACSKGSGLSRIVQ